MPGTSQNGRDRPNGSRGDRSNNKRTETTTTTPGDMERTEKVAQDQEPPARPLAQLSLTPDTSVPPSYTFPTAQELRRTGEQITLQKIKSQMYQAARIPKNNVIVKEDITEWMARLLDLHGFSIERLSNGNFRVSW